jgi:protein-L-isoaspartate(D-aspartate) O-methyltransferase
MAWRSSSTSHKGLVANLAAGGLIKTPAVERAMLLVDRRCYVPPGKDPYEDAPQPIGYGATISAPHMHAWCLELLADRLTPDARALDVGSGSGYFSVLMAAMMTANANGAPVTGKVVGVEHIVDLAFWAEQNVAKDPSHLAHHVKFVAGDGRLGYPKTAPYDVIHVGAAALGLPFELIKQLKVPGRLVAPIEENGVQELVCIDKTGPGIHDFTTRKLGGVRYVPLTDRSHYT